MKTKFFTAITVTALLLVAQASLPVSARAQIETNLHSFVGYPTDGNLSYPGLVQGSDGSFYGTTFYGGTNNAGTVFRISPSGSYTNLYSFAGPPTDGNFPEAVPIQGRDGNFYGTTYYGGTKSCDCGTVFRISPSGNYTSLYSFADFPSDGANPFAGLVQGSDGNFYGTTYYGGTNGDGTVFRISPSGNYTSLYSFTTYPAGNFPYAALAQGSDGNFYGTTGSGGMISCNCGTVFRINPSGSYTTLYSFVGSPSDGSVPYGGLVQGSDGNFYGTTGGGGTYSMGTVFRISPSGNYTNLYSFGSVPNDGSGPEAETLVQGSDGNFYGTTFQGGTSTNCNLGCGTLFRISPDGSYTNLYSFTGNYIDGRFLQAGLVQGSDGSFYGTTGAGGTNDQGTVFRLSIPLNPPANQISAIQFFILFGDSYGATLIPSVAGETYQLQYTDSMMPTNWVNTGDPITSIGGPLTLIDFIGTLPPQRFYRAVITP